LRGSVKTNFCAKDKEIARSLRDLDNQQQTQLMPVPSEFIERFKKWHQAEPHLALSHPVIDRLMRRS